MTTKEHLSLRLDTDVVGRVRALAKARNQTTTQILRVVVEHGLEVVETGRKIDIQRLVAMIEKAAIMSDIAAQALAPDQAVKCPQLVMSNLEKFHALD